MGNGDVLLTLRKTWTAKNEHEKKFVSYCIISCYAIMNESDRYQQQIDSNE